MYSWAHGYGGSDDDTATAVATDGSGNVYITGMCAGTVTFGTQTLTSAGSTDIFLVSLDPAGGLRWVKRFGAAGSDVGHALAADASNNIYLTGMFQGSVSFGGATLTAQGADIVLASFDSAGNHRWSKSFGGSSTDIGYALAVDKSNNVSVTGEYRDTVDFGGGPLTAKTAVYQELYLASFAANGAFRWAKSFGTTNAEVGNSLAVDATGNVYLAGVFWASGLDLGGGPMANVGQDDMFLASFTNAGVHRWSKSFGSAGSEQPMGVAADGSGNVNMTGFFEKALSFGGTTLTPSNRDGFIASFDGLGNHRWSQREACGHET